MIEHRLEVSTFVFFPFAAHEAGHALMYGLGEETPEDLYTYIDPEVLRRCSGVRRGNHTDRTTLELRRFRWMVFAAGAAGEYVRLGTISLSVHHDFVSFDAIALYFMLAAGYPVVVGAKTEEQHAANAAAIAKLREEMAELAKDVIEANRSAHDQLIGQLKQARTRLRRHLANSGYSESYQRCAQTCVAIDGSHACAWPIARQQRSSSREPARIGKRIARA